MTLFNKVFALLKKVDQKLPIQKTISQPLLPKMEDIPRVNLLQFDYVIFELETLNTTKHNLCSVAIVALKNAKVVARKQWYVRPVSYEGVEQYCQKHHIKPKTLKKAKSFPKVWEELFPFVENQHLVANKMIFELEILKATLIYHDIKIPRFKTTCIYKTAQRTWGLPDFRLSTLKNYLGFKVTKYRNSLTTADACAKVFIYMIKHDLLVSKSQSKNPIKKSVKAIEKVKEIETPKLAKAIVAIEVPKQVNLFCGKNIAVSGSFQHFNQLTIKHKLKEIGANFVKNVTSKTAFLIEGQHNTNEKNPKRIDAFTYNVKIINEEQFLTILARQNSFQEIERLTYN